jgi:hypothetical protein
LVPTQQPDAQLALARQVGLMLTGDEPPAVAAVLLEDHLRPAIWGDQPVPDATVVFVCNADRLRDEFGPGPVIWGSIGVCTTVPDSGRPIDLP